MPKLQFLLRTRAWVVSRNSIKELQENHPDKKLIENRYAFTGRELEDETGLYYYRARYYDPELGRFISEDPIGFGGGDTNLFSYVANDPVNLIDPSGNCPWCIGAVVGAVASGVVTYVSGGSASEIVASAAVGAVAGAASMGLSALTTSAAGIVAVNAGVGAVSNVATQIANGTLINQLNSTSVLIGAIAGGAGGAIGLGVGTSAFYRTPVIGGAVGLGAANRASILASTFSGTAAASGIEYGAGICR